MPVSAVKQTSARLLSAPGQILKELQRSKSRGNVLGIWAIPLGENMRLTAIEDVKNIEGADEKLVILKKYDLQGVFINAHEILLSEIKQIRSFRRKYHDTIALFDRLEVQPEHELVKIRRLEQKVSVHELEIILVRIINSGCRILITLWDHKLVLADPCFVVSFESGESDIIMASSSINGDDPRVVTIEEVACIEFDFFFSYKGLSSKIFCVNNFESDRH